MKITIRDIDVDKMYRATNIPLVAIEAAFQQPDSVADDVIASRALQLDNGITTKPYEYLYHFGSLEMGGRLEFAAIRRAAVNYLRT